MILSDTAIRDEMENGNIIISPFDDAALGGNSYDVHLSPHFLTYPQQRGAALFEKLPLDERR